MNFYEGRSLRVSETPCYSRQSPEYKLGVLQMKQWHERCRCKRLGIPFRPLKLRANHGPDKIYERMR